MMPWFLASRAATCRIASRSPRLVHRTRHVGVLLLPLLVLAACDSGVVSEDPPSTTPQVARVVVTPAVATLAADSTVSLTASVLGPNDEVMDEVVTWNTSSQERATVSTAGEVVAGRLLGGNDATVTITATAANRSGAATITVQPVPAAHVTLDYDDVSMMLGAARQLQVTVTSAADETLTGRTVSWSSSDDDVVQVTASGAITAAGPGTAAVTATVGDAQGQATVRVLDAQTYAFPVALEDVSWPWSYLEPSLPGADTPSDPCAIGLQTLRVPREFMGSRPLPELTGPPLGANVLRGIGSKDVWQRGNPSFAEGCSGDVRAEFLRTLDRVAALGGDYITLVPWTFISVDDGEWTIVNPAELGSSVVEDDDLRWAVQQAHARGIGVHWINQIQGAFDGDHFFDPEPTRDNVATFLEAYKPYMLERAAFLEDIGADGMQVSCTCWAYLENEEYADLYEAALAELLPAIRSTFTGDIRMAADRSVLNNAAIRNSVDVLEISFAFGVHGLDADALTLSLATSQYTMALQGEVGIYASANKPFLVDIHAVSRANHLTTGYLEETFCVAEFGTIWGSPTACIQREQDTDFSLQALLYAAKLDVVRQNASLGIYAVEAKDYWMVDQLVPSSTFPNLAVSPRNKPAEGVLKYFFRR